MANTILLVGCGVRQEATGSGVIRPGFLVVLNSANKFAAHSVAGGVASKRFAIENDLQGKGIMDSYPDGAIVQAIVAQPGDMVQAYLQNAQSVVVGALLESAGNGTLRAHATGVALAIAREAKVAPDDVLIKIEIL